jgi:hypothetical protein
LVRGEVGTDHAHFISRQALPLAASDMKLNSPVMIRPVNDINASMPAIAHKLSGEAVKED